MRKLIIVAAALGLAACSSKETGSAAVVASISHALTSSVDHITLTITGPGMTPIVHDLAQVGGNWQGIISGIPVGNANRDFQGDAYDAAGTLLYSGHAGGVTISAGVTTQVAIVLQEINPPPPFNHVAPVIDSVVLSASSVATNGNISMTVTAHDPNPGDTQPLVYSWTATAGTFSAPAATTTSWTAPASEGMQQLTIQVTDQYGSMAAMTMTVDVTDASATGTAAINVTFNNWPVVNAMNASPSQVDVNQTTTLTAGVADADGDTLSYGWTSTCAGTFDDSTLASPAFTIGSGNAASCTFTVDIADGRGGHNSGTLAIAIGPQAQPTFAPVIDHVFQSTGSAYGDGSVSFDVTAHDPNGQPLTYSWTQSSGSLSAVMTPSTTWTADACFAANATITIIVSNSSGLSTAQALTVTTLGPDAAACPHAIGGNVTGLMGTLILQDNGGDDLQLTADGTFTFTTRLLTGAAYSVSVASSPLGQACTVSNDMGTVAGADVTNVLVSCM